MWRGACLALLLCCTLVASAVPSGSDHGVIIQVKNTYFVELAVAGPSSFRVSVAYEGQPSQIQTSMVAPPSSYAKFEKFTYKAAQGIKTSFGAVVINSTTGAFFMLDAAGKEIVNSPDFSSYQGHGGGKGDTCKEVIPESDASGGSRTPAHPDGLGGQTQDSCCTACNDDVNCTFWVFAPEDPSDGKNCWLLMNVEGRHSAGPNRVTGGQTTGGTDTVFISLSRTSTALFYGAGGTGGTGLTVTSSSPYVANREFMTPHYWSTDGYSALGVSPFAYTPSNLVAYPASWASTTDQSATVTSWTIAGSSVDLYLSPAATQYDGMRTYWELTGPPAVLPRYAYGFLACRWGWKDSNYIMDILQQFRSGGYPIDAWISDFGWFTQVNDYNLPPTGSPTYHDFGYNNITFPSPAQQLAQYHKMGFRFGGIRKPRLGNTDLLAMAKSKGWLIGVSPNDVTDGPGRNINYSIPEARLWYGQQHQQYINDGVDFWWNDEGETLYFTFNDWNVAQFDFLTTAKPNKRFFSINRAFTPGMQRLGATVWTGDISVDWNTLAETPGTMLAWTLAGAGAVTCDIGGFSGGDSPPDLLVRWYEVGTFLGLFRVHSTKDDTPHFPFLYPADAAAAMKKALQLRYQLLPTIYSYAHDAYSTGAPIFRPLVMEFPDDTKAASLTSEWLLGANVLVAPVLRQDATVTVYLPAGTWYEFNTTNRVEGPTSFTKTDVPLDFVPIYVRAGAVFALAPVVQYTDQLPGGPLELHAYEPNGDFVLHEDDGETYDYQKGAVQSTTFTISGTSLKWAVANPQKFPTNFAQFNVKCFTPTAVTVSDTMAITPTGTASVCT